MLSTLRNAWKIPDLRKRMMFTLLMVVIIRMGIYIPVPGVDASKLVDITSNGGTLFSFYDMPNAKFIVAIFIADFCIVGIEV